VWDAFFALVNLARWYNVDAESALREAVLRFIDRFREVERRLRQQGRSLQEATLEEMDTLWEEIKREEKDNVDTLWEEIKREEKDNA